jgi:hypothetical protein
MGCWKDTRRLERSTGSQWGGAGVGVRPGTQGLLGVGQHCMGTAAAGLGGNLWKLAAA